ncbi:MAG: TadE/TadG family type IV pilus assembly protein [Hyphomicrobiaceae bacterium]
MTPADRRRGTPKPKRSGALRRLCRDTGGLAALEFAMVVPLMALLMLGTLEISQAYVAHRKLERITASVADLIARETSPTATTINQILDVAEVLIVPYAAERLSITATYITDTDGKRTTEWQCWNGIGTQAPAPAALPPGVLETNGKVIVVAASYQHETGVTKLVVREPIDLTETYFAKLRQLTFTGPKPSGSGCS